MFYHNMLKYSVLEKVRSLGVKSEIAAEGCDKELSLVFIDGDHSYESCRLDASTFKGWWFSCFS